MIKRFFYIFSASLFVMTAPNMGVKANVLDKELEAIERHQKAPPGINYQAVLRDSEGDILANTSVTLRLSILTAETGGTTHWEETHSVTTNAFGLINVIIGEGTRTGGDQTTFTAVPWDASDMFLKVEVDQGSGFVEMGTEQLQSVPYALSAGNIPTDINELEDEDGLLGSTVSAQSLDFTDQVLTLSNDPNSTQIDLSNYDDDASDDLTSADLAFTTIGNITSNSSGNLGNDSFVFGSNNMAEDDETNDDDKRMFFDKSTGAFRVGGTSNYESWDLIGSYSFAAGIRNGARGDYSVVAGGAGNYANGGGSSIGGGVENAVDGELSTIAGGGGNEIGNSTNPSNYAFIGAGINNSIGGETNGSVVAGGQGNTAYGSFNTIAGGYFNSSEGTYSSVGGGRQNTASNTHATVSGGSNNIANADGSTVGGGVSNRATGGYATVGGGSTNTSSGLLSTIGGGQSNLASGYRSTIPGGEGHYARSWGEVALGMFSTDTTPFSAFSYNASDRLLVVGNGPDGGNRSDALVMLKNGDTDINGNLVANSLGIDGEFTLPTADGAAGQSLTTDGSGNVTWQDGGGFSGSYNDLTNIPANLDTDATDDFSGSYNDLTDLPTNLDTDATDDFSGSYNDLTDLPANLDTDATDDLTTSDLAFTTAANLTSNSGGTIASDSFVFGSTSMDDVAGGDDNTRMFFDKSTSSFRAGRVSATQWDNSNLGSITAAFGYNNLISGSMSSILGGFNNQISSTYSAIAAGEDNNISGFNSFIGSGYRNSITGSYSIIGGGTNHNVSGNNATIVGGASLTAESFGQTTIGLANTIAAGNAGSFVATDRLFVIGNGSGSRSDALVMLKNGNTDINGNLVS